MRYVLRFIVLMLIGLVVSGAAAPTHPTSGAKITRPILYYDIKTVNGTATAVWRAVTMSGNEVSSPNPGDGTPSWSPDGKWIAILTHDRLLVQALDGKNRDLFTAQTGENIVFEYGPAWSPDGKKLAMLVNSGNTFSSVIVSVSDASVLARYPVRTPASDPNFGGAMRNLFNQTALQTLINCCPRDAFTWSPDGTKILLSVGDCFNSGPHASVIDTTTGDVQSVADGPVVAEWTPDSKAVYYLATVPMKPGKEPCKLGDLNLKPLGQPPVKLLDPEQLVTAGVGQEAGFRAGVMALSPDGSRLAVAAGAPGSKNGNVVIFTINRETNSPGSASRIYQSQSTDIAAIDWSPDGKALAVESAFPKVEIQRLELSTGTWTKLADVSITRDEIDILGDKTLSWTR